MATAGDIGRFWASARALLLPLFRIHAVRALLSLLSLLSSPGGSVALGRRADFWSGGWPHGLLRARDTPALPRHKLRVVLCLARRAHVSVREHAAQRQAELQDLVQRR